MNSRPVLRTVSALVLCALLGVVLGAWSGYATVQREMHAEVGRMASSFISRADELDDEATDALEEIGATIVPTCSERDLARLRNIVVSSHFLKIASRLDGRRLLCSSSLGVLAPAPVLPVPDFVTEHGRAVSLDAPLYDMPGTRALTIEQGTAAVVINRDSYKALIDPRLNYAVVADYFGNRKLFLSERVPTAPLESIALTDGEPVTLDGRRHEVRCSLRHTGCIVAAMREPDTILNSPVFLGFSVLGLVAGLGAGFGLSLGLARMNSVGRKLRLALRTGDLEVVYQPIVRLSDRQRVGAEALLRWRDSEGRHVSPDVFIAVAEEEGFISDVTRFVLRRVLIELGDALRSHPGFRITVNMSVRDLLDSTFPSFVAHTLKAARVEASSIGFEITERSTAEHAAIGRGIAQLRQAGHLIYIDDFGTDYSSLSYLAQLHVDAIKLDRAFTLALHEEGAGDTIAPQLVTMVRKLGLTLVVEGIEKERQAAFFLALDPDALSQGWLFGKPMTGPQLFDI